MKAIITLEIQPAAQACVTPLELLEDFADSVSSWLFLEAESLYYAEAKGVPACVLRHVSATGQEDFDLAFAAAGPGEQAAFRLLVIDAPGLQHHLSPPMRQEAVQHFLEAFSAYLDAHNRPARLHTVERELDRAAAGP